MSRARRRMAPFRLDGWTVEPDRNRIARGRKERHLQAREMDLLLRLVEGRGDIVSKQDLLSDVWMDRCVVEHVLPKTVSSLRKLLGECARQPRIVETIPKRGYRLACEVTKSEPAPPSRWQLPRSFGAALALGSLALVMIGSSVPSLLPIPPEAIEPGDGVVVRVELKIKHRYVWEFDTLLDPSEVSRDLSKPGSTVSSSR